MKQSRHTRFLLLTLALSLAASAGAAPQPQAQEPGGLANPQQTAAPEDQASAWPYRFEISGNIAHGRFNMGSHLWGSGFDYGGGLGVRPFSGRLRGLGVEVQLARLKQGEEISATNSSDLDSRLVSANALYHFRGRTRVQPYVLGGVGHVNLAYSRRCGNCVTIGDPLTGPLVPVPYEWHTTDSKMGITLGGGLKVAINRHLSVRTELLVVNTTAGSGGNYGWLRLQTGVGFHF